MKAVILLLVACLALATAYHHGYAHSERVTDRDLKPRTTIGSMYRDKLEDYQGSDDQDDDDENDNSFSSSSSRSVRGARFTSGISGAGLLSSAPIRSMVAERFPTLATMTRRERRAGLRSLRASEDVQPSDDDDSSTFDCSGLTVLDCFMQHPRTKLFAKMMEKYEKISRRLATGSNMESQTWWKNLIAQVQGSSQITFFAPSNKAMWKFTKFVKKYFPVPFTTRFLAALGAYHLIPSTVGLLSNPTQQQGVLSYNEMSNGVTASGSNCFALTTALTSPEYVNKGNMGQIVSISKCPSTGELLVNWGVHGSKLFSARFVVKDIPCKNGVMHVISKVLFFPQSPLILMKLTGKTSFGAAILSAGLPQLFESLPSVMVLIPPNQHVDALQTAIYNNNVGSNSLISNDQLQLLWKEHIITQGSYLPTLASGTDLKTAGSYSLNFRFEMENNKKVYFIGGAKVLNVALTRNGLMLFIDRILEIPSVPLVQTINQKLSNEVLVADI